MFHVERLKEIAREHRLPARAVERFDTVLRVVAEDPTAPTTVTDPAAGADVHIADSCDGLALDVVRDARAIADIGAGAGFPGLVLAIALPSAQVTLIESVGKKCEFIARVIAAADIPNATPVHARAEGWPAGIGIHDVVTARALAPLTALVEYAAPLLREGGHLVAWKGVRDAGEEADGAAAARETGLELVEVRAMAPRVGADARHLHVFRKAAPTPSRYPRREGMARKRPITAT